MLDNATLEREATRLAIEHGLTEKQAKYVAIKTTEPISDNQAIARAGMSPRNTGIVRKSKRIAAATQAELARKAEIAEKAEQLRQALAENPREAITNKLAQHAEDATIAPNQTRAVELLAKISGVMVERVEIDPGEFLRSRLGAKLYGEENGQG